MGFLVYILFIGGVISLLFAYKKMAKPGNPFFKIGYFLYTRTPVGYMYYRREVAKAARKYNNGAHTNTEAVMTNGLRIWPIAMSMDNFSYLVTDMKSQVSILVDPADPDSVQPVLDKENITPTAVLTTHKHWDHSGGNKEWQRRYRSLRIYGGANDSIPGCTNPVADGEAIRIGNLSFEVMYTPGHTSGHVVYLLDGSPFGAPKSLFSGDHIFIGGIGRMFEGTSHTMLQSLERVCEQPDDTFLWPGHEYAVDNLEFAEHVDPDNEHLKAKLMWSRDRRKGKQQTCPSTLGEEKLYNPFLRTGENHIQHKMGINPEEYMDSFKLRADTLSECRKRKDKFKYKL